LVTRAVQIGYLVELHVMLVPEDLAVARVAHRRLWELIAQARQIAHRSRFYDNSRSAPFSPVAIYELGRPVGTPAWPRWTPAALTG
jgi:predicted ABC-type ATPase